MLCCESNAFRCGSNLAWYESMHFNAIHTIADQVLFKGKSNGFSEFWDIMRVLMLFQSFSDRFNACCKEVNLYSAI